MAATCCSGHEHTGPQSRVAGSSSRDPRIDSCVVIRSFALISFPRRSPCITLSMLAPSARLLHHTGVCSIPALDSYEHIRLLACLLSGGVPGMASSSSSVSLPPSGTALGEAGAACQCPSAEFAEPPAWPLATASPAAAVCCCRGHSSCCGLQESCCGDSREGCAGGTEPW